MLQRNAKVVSIDGYEDVSPFDEMSLKKAVAHQPVSVAIEAGGRAFQHYESVSFSRSLSRTVTFFKKKYQKTPQKKHKCKSFQEIYLSCFGYLVFTGCFYWRVRIGTGPRCCCSWIWHRKWCGLLACEEFLGQRLG